MTDPASRDELWAAVVRLTQVVVEQVQAEEWEMAAESEEQRLAAIKAYCAPPLSDEDAAAVGHNLRALAEVQERLLGAGNSAREALAARLRELEAGRRASTAYGANSPTR